jgi:NTE family protein
VNTVREMGADFVIAVNVIPDLTERIKQAKGFKEPGIFHVMLQSIYITTYALVRASLEGADVVIEPQVAHIGYGDFHQAADCIAQGELASQHSIPEIKKQLGR